MMAINLKPKHIGGKFRAKADGAPMALQGGLSDYALVKNRGKTTAVVVWINGHSLRLRPDATITPVEGHHQKGEGQLL